MEKHTQSYSNKLTVVDFFLMFLFSITVLGFLVPGLSDVGLGWDEGSYFRSGTKYLHWLTHPMISEFNPSWGLNHEHPPIHKIFAGFTKYIFSDVFKFCTPMVGYRMSTLFFSIILVFSLYALAKKICGRFEAIFCSVILFLVPRVFYHAHMVSLDFSSMAMWTLLSLIIWKNWVTNKNFVLVGFVSGLSILTKFNSVFALLARVGLGLKRHFFSNKRWESTRFFLKNELRFFISLGGIIFLMMILLWPWMWPNPGRIFEFIAFHLKHSHISTFYFGKTYLSAPWHYPYLMLLITTPVALLVLFVIGFVSLLLRLRENKAFFILLNFWFPILLVQLSSAKYDGVRLFLPSFPYMVLIAAIGAKVLVKPIPYLFLKKSVLAIQTLALLFYLIFQHVMYYPYEGSYFNELVKGIKGADRIGFDIHYWCNGYQDLLEWIHQNNFKKFWVAQCSHLFKEYNEFGKIDWTINQVDHPNDADYWIVVNRPSSIDVEFYKKIRNEKPVVKVQANGVELVGVYEKKNL